MRVVYGKYLRKISQMSKNQVRKKIVLFLGGSDFQHQDILISRELKIIRKDISQYSIVAVDHGADFTLNSDLLPNIAIGDFDSISESNLQKLKQEKISLYNFPTHKDATDSELAFEYLHDQVFSEVIIFGLEGDRPDHFLSNILTMNKLVRGETKIKAVGKKSFYYFSADSLTITGKKNDLLSLLALTPSVGGLTTHGLEYPLQKATLLYGTSLGISNVFMQSQVKIDHQAGILLAIHTPLS